jgi:hypothetical protein
MSTKTFIAQIFKWLAQVNADHELPPNAVKVAVRLAPDFNEEHGGMAWSGLQTMANDIGLAKGTVTNMVRRLQANGHLRVEFGQQGKGHSNHYWMVLQGQQGDLFEDPKRSTQDDLLDDTKRSTKDDLLDPAKRSNSDPSKGQIQGVKRSNSAPKRSTALELTHLDSSKTHRGSKTPRPDCSAGKSEDAPEGKKQGDPFAEFWAAYPKRVAKEAARRAFAAALKRGVSPEVLTQGARRYAAERASEDPYYTKHPSTWLRGGCWEDGSDHDGSPVIDQDGNDVEPAPARRSHGSKSVAEIAQEIIDEGIFK